MQEHLVFFSWKNLGGFGDGGALITNSKIIFENALRLRNHGAKKSMIISFLVEIPD